ncbi:hypothetical protein AKJ18_19795 [Vibrio xuii]|nr:hypothetical protein AKJ18_19795 [Vibrio xuii]
MEYFKNMTSSDVIAICAVFIAILSFVSTAWQAWLMRTHNKMSVRPHVEIIGDYMRGNDISYIISNDGLGPAIISTVELTLNNERYEVKDYDDFKSALMKIDIDIDKLPHKIRIMEMNTAIGVSKNVLFMGFPKSGTDISMRLDLERKLKKMDITISYKCIYGKEFKVTLPGHGF